MKVKASRQSGCQHPGGLVQEHGGAVSGGGGW